MGISWLNNFLTILYYYIKENKEKKNIINNNIYLSDINGVNNFKDYYEV